MCFQVLHGQEIREYTSEIEKNTGNHPERGLLQQIDWLGSYKKLPEEHQAGNDQQDTFQYDGRFV